MKLPLKVAGLCWSLTFLVTAMPGFYQQIKPTDFTSISADTFSGMNILEKLALSLAGSMMAGTIGYIIGDILSKPQGLTKAEREAKNKKAAKVQQAEPEPEKPTASEEPALETAQPPSEQSNEEAVAQAAADPYP